MIRKGRRKRGKEKELERTVIIRMFCSLSFLFLVSTVYSLTMTVSPKKDVCIWESGKVGDQLYASYEITKGESKFVKVSVKLFVVL